jgi:hypothetical protein
VEQSGLGQDIEEPVPVDQESSAKRSKKHGRGGSSKPEPDLARLEEVGSRGSVVEAADKPTGVNAKSPKGEGGGRRGATVAPPPAILAAAESGAAHLAPKRRGRPSTIKNMAAYKAQKQREYRERLKAETNVRSHDNDD